MVRTAGRTRRPQRRFRMKACAGYALLLYVCQMTLWGGLPLTSRIPLSLTGLFESWSVPLCVALAFVCAAAGCVALRSSRPPSARASIATAAAASAAMAAGYPSAAWMGGADLNVCAGAALLGAGMAMSFCLWCSVFARMGAFCAAKYTLVSAIASSAISLATFGLALEGLEMSFFLAVVLSSALLVSALYDTSATQPDTPCADCAPRVERGAFSSMRDLLEGVRVPLLCACAIAFAVAITRMMSLTAAPGMAAVINVIGVLFAAIAASMLLLFAWKKGRAGSGVGIPSLFQILFPLVATLLLVMSMAGPVAAAVVGAAVFAIHSIMFALVMPACIEAADEVKEPFVAVYGFFAGAVFALFASATYLGAVLFERGESEVSVSFVAVLLVLYVLAMADALVHRRARSAAAHPQADVVSDSPVALLHEGSTGGDLREGGPCGTCHDGDVEGVWDDDRAGADPIERRCLNVARAYGLSPRETDVLVAFAHGRNVAYLAEHLVLSANTIRSHSKTLYAKLGVHSKQELIDLVEREG